MEQIVEVPFTTFQRMTRALIEVEKFLKERDEQRQEWVSEEKACELLGCFRTKLYELKGKEIKYKKVGRKHQYCAKSIKKYNESASS